MPALSFRSRLQPDGYKRLSMGSPVVVEQSNQESTAADGQSEGSEPTATLDERPGDDLIQENRQGEY